MARKSRKQGRETQGPGTAPVASTPSTPEAPKQSLSTVLADLELSPEAKARIESAAKSGGKRARRKSAEEIFAAYSHAVEGTLTYDEGSNKQSVEIACQHPGCKSRRRVFTSDLFQVRVCADHRKAQRKAARIVKREEAKAALATATADAEPKPEGDKPSETPEA